MPLRDVALRKESVDRNTGTLDPKKYDRTSLSARRAWIEMKYKPDQTILKVVALRKESVDRNFHGMYLHLFVCSRSPQGERG